MSVFAGWGWCWLCVVLTKLVDDVVKSGDCWQSWMIWMMTWYVFTGAGWVCNELDDYILIVVGGDWVTGWLGNGGESECVCGAGWVLVRSVDRVCVGGGGDGGWGQWWVLTELDDNDDDLVCVHWDWVCNELDDCILTYWWEMVASLDGWEWGWVRCVCAGWVLVSAVDCVCVCVCVCGGGGGGGGGVCCWQSWMILMMTWYVFTE